MGGDVGDVDEERGVLLLRLGDHADGVVGDAVGQVEVALGGPSIRSSTEIPVG